MDFYDHGFTAIDDGASLDGFLDIDHAGNAKIGSDVAISCPNVRVCEEISKIPNPNLGMKQRIEKDTRLLIENPETVHGKGKQIRLPHMPESETMEKQIKTLRETRDPDRSTSKAQSTNPVIGSSINHSVPKVESTKRTGMAKLDSSMDYESRLELSKRKLREGYGAADRAKRQRRIAVLDYHPDLPVSTVKVVQRKRKPCF